MISKTLLQSHEKSPRVPAICASIVAGIALLALFGWVSGARFLAGELGAYIPMAPSTALAFLLLSGALFGFAHLPASRLIRLFELTAVSIVLSLGLLVLGQSIFGIGLGMEQVLSRTNEFLGSTPLGRMSPLTAIAFLLEGVAFFILPVGERWRNVPTAVTLLAAAATAINTIVLMGYAFGAPLLYGGRTIPVALPTAIAFVLVGMGQLSLAAPGVTALREWSGASMRGILLRAFLPFLLFFILLDSWVDAAFAPMQKLNPAVWYSLKALAAGALIVITIGWIARRTGGEIERAQTALAEGEARYRHTLDDMLEGCQIIGHDWRYLYLNDIADKHNRRPKEELLGRKYMEMWPGIESTHVFTVIRRCKEERLSQSMENEFTFPDGSKGWFELRIYPVPEGIVILSIDITERKRAEEEIATLAKFPTENPNPILRVQRDGQVNYANAASQELLEVWRCEVNDYLPEELKDLITVVMDDNLNKTLDIYCNDKVYSIMLVPILEGGYVNIYGRDITERQRAEGALHRLTEDLQRSNAELEQFAYVASHDLQEPLRMISSYVQLLGRRYRGKLDSDADEFIDFAVDGAKRMQNLINDLLAYSRVGTRSNPLVPLAAEDLLKEAVANLQFLIEESGAKITHEPLPVVKGDFTQLVTVFQNLLGNAIKFRGAEPPCIHIAAHQAEEEWIFCVRDNGIGIDPKFAERIFVIFQRLNDRTAYPGTGIGLAIGKRVIQRHGGRIWVESKPGEGAAFYFTLPVKETL